MIEAIIGIAGTILGTFMGWFLNNMSQAGKLKVYINSWTDSFQYNHIGCMEPSNSVDQTEYYGYVLDIDLYNSSGEMKIARNVEVLFLNGKNELRKSVPHDEATKVFSSPITHYYDVEPINIPPKTVVKYRLRNGFWRKEEGLDFLWKTTQICLRYTDEKDVVRTVPIKSEKYSTYFETHKQEGQANADA